MNVGQNTEKRAIESLGERDQERREFGCLRLREREINRPKTKRQRRDSLAGWAGL